MKKVIFFISALFIVVSVIVSCTGKCSCGFYSNGNLIGKQLEVEKHKKNCKDQSGVYETYYYTDTLGIQQVVPDSSAHFICK